MARISARMSVRSRAARSTVHRAQGAMIANASSSTRSRSMYTEASCAARWTALMAPRTGDLKGELVSEATEFFGVTPEEVRSPIEGAAHAFKSEWLEQDA